MSLPEFGPSADHMLELEAALWTTGDHASAGELERAVKLTGRRSRGRAAGSLALARWDFYRGDAEEALRRLDGILPSDPMMQEELDLFRADCLCLLNEGRSALTVLSRMTGRHTADQNLLLRVGHARSLLGKAMDHGSGPMTEALNGIYSSAGFGMIRRNSVLHAVGLDNIACDVRESEPAESLPLVTVVVRLPDSLPEGHGAMSSLLDQSWRNLEILLPGGSAISERLDAADPDLLQDDRIVVVEEDGETGHPLASGAAHATGELLTTHLYGSWAHPQRIEAQATGLMVNPSLSGTVSHHMNVSSGLDPRPLAMTPRRDLVGPNPRSTMIRSSGLTSAEVVAAYDRTAARYSPVTGNFDPPQDVAVVNDGVPLTLTLASARPTTASPPVVSS